MKTFALLMIFSFVCFAVTTEGQNKKHKKSVSKSSKLKDAKIIPRIISMGVVNGRAIDLVKPEYPKSARVVNVYGQVSVQILIDENGKVISAKANSGSPLLQSVCINAALNSTFEPVILSGEAIRVSGIIHYNFTPQQWNWLEIGFAINNVWSDYYLTENLSETLPTDYVEEKQLLQLLLKSSKNRDEIKNTIIASISGRLSNDEKSSWLFSVGLILGQMKQNCCWVDDEMQKSIAKIKTMLQSKPENISNHLVANLEKLVLYAENPKLNIYDSIKGNRIYQTLKCLEQIFPHYK